MTDKEIRLELAKVALAEGASVETAKVFYEWITEKPASEATEYDDIPIEVLASKERGMKGLIANRCRNNGINTIGDLVRMGGLRFEKLPNVGRKLLSVIDDRLYEDYGITDWKYK